MIATNQLRWVKRYHDTMSGQKIIHVLQQKWEQREWAHDQEIVTAEEWRDVPLAKEDV